MRLSTLSRSQQKKGLLSHISDPRIVPRQRVLRLEGRIGLSMKHLKSNTASFPTLLYTIRFVWQEHKSYPDSGAHPLPDKSEQKHNSSTFVVMSRTRRMACVHAALPQRFHFPDPAILSCHAMPRRRVLAQPRPNAAPPPL